MRFRGIITAVALALACSVSAQDAAPSAPVDVLAVRPAAEGWIWAMRHWSPPSEPRDLAGGRFQAILGAGRWGFALRADAVGMPGEFVPDKAETFRALEASLAVHRNVGGNQLAQFGPCAALSVARSLELREGVAPKTASPLTAGVGVRVAGPGWWAYAVVGQHQSLRGVSGVLTYQVRTTDRTAATGTFGFGARGVYVATLGVAVRWF